MKSAPTIKPPDCAINIQRDPREIENIRTIGNRTLFFIE
jgi:hypothetical protein